MRVRRPLKPRSRLPPNQSEAAERDLDALQASNIMVADRGDNRAPRGDIHDVTYTSKVMALCIVRHRQASFKVTFSTIDGGEDKCPLSPVRDVARRRDTLH